MTPEEIQQIIVLAERAPLANMREAQAASLLLKKLAEHFAPKAAPVPTPKENAKEPTPTKERERDFTSGEYVVR